MDNFSIKLVQNVLLAIVISVAWTWHAVDSYHVGPNDWRYQHNLAQMRSSGSVGSDYAYQLAERQRLYGNQGDLYSSASTSLNSYPEQRPFFEVEAEIELGEKPEEKEPPRMKKRKTQIHHHHHHHHHQRRKGNHGDDRLDWTDFLRHKQKKVFSLLRVSRKQQNYICWGKDRGQVLYFHPTRIFARYFVC